MGVPTTYTQEMADEICETISNSPKGIRRLRKENPHWPNVDTIFNWRLKNKKFAEQYTKAKSDQIDVLVDQILHLCDDKSKDFVDNNKGEKIYNTPHLTRMRYKIDAIKWLAGKLAPKIYGDKSNNDNDGKVKPEDALKELE